ncbi:AGE family epimerase/isomerase [Reichenbachiella ulvae]|uniref:Cellobiose 2-epimerase n=1 Tax=Reichenbachiella ulvae TaxID=2980104 RepID=A0ABT3CZ36_9BACT|nr:AGE family epimerase/isomerase [Reichenbachiella ulvae]MCV9388824.1 AGE family epimerase/isomerase [Reichenbachiella ulvae]
MITKQEAEKVLNENILSFWEERMVDNENGGFYGRIDGEGVLHPQSDKAIILNTRILWTFSAAYRYTQNPNHKAMADRAYHYICDHFFDSEHGGVFWMLDYQGEVKDPKKQVYAQAFAIYALSEYVRMNGSEEALELAIGLFELLEKHSFDPQRNGYFEAFAQDWSLIEDVRLSEKDMNATKTMNTHLHVLEAYTNLYRVWKDEKLEEDLRNLINEMSTRFVSDKKHFNLFFDDDWNLLSDEISFGHDIEGSWLLAEAADVIEDDELIQKTNELALNMADAALRGLDKDGGLMNEASPHGLTDTDKHWWPQAEALVGFVNAWQLSQDERYLIVAASIWQFTKEYIIDPAGEWHWRVTRDHQLVTGEDKAGPWKCPYHNGRAMMEVMERL